MRRCSVYYRFAFRLRQNQSNAIFWAVNFLFRQWLVKATNFCDTLAVVVEYRFDIAIAKAHNVVAEVFIYLLRLNSLKTRMNILDERIALTLRVKADNHILTLASELDSVMVGHGKPLSVVVKVLGIY